VCKILIYRDKNAAKNILARELRLDPNAPQVEAMKQFKDAESIVVSQEDGQIIYVPITWQNHQSLIRRDLE